MALNQATKYGLFFVGGIAVGALGMALVSRGKLNIKPLATDLLASGIDLRDKALAAVDGGNGKAFSCLKSLCDA